MIIQYCRGLCALLVFTLGAAKALGEDTDIFAGGLIEGGAAPNILVVFDNTSNWAKQSQQWPARKVCPDLTTYVPETIQDASGESIQNPQYPGSYTDESVCPEIDEQQGQAEAAALKSALAKVLDFSPSGFKLGIMEFTTQGTANEDGGFVRVHMSDYTEAAQQAHIDAALREIHANVNEPIEKRNANTPYGNLMYDIYNYLAGDTQSYGGQGTPTGTYDYASDGSTVQYDYADGEGYSSNYSVFSSPLDDGDVCAETYIIFVSNPNQNGPATDSAVNSLALKNLYGGTAPAALAGDGGAGLQMPEFIEVKGKATVGYTEQCYQNLNACKNEINGNVDESQEIQNACPAEGGECSCANINNNDQDAPEDSCNGGKSLFRVTTDATGAYYRDETFIDGADFNMDDWTKFLYEQGVTVQADPDGDGIDEDVQAAVTTFTLDVYNKAPETEHSSLMASAAEVAGGYRLQAGDYEDLEEAFVKIFSDILAVNTSFSAVSLPLSATNRTQAENKIFVGMFRPAQSRKPRWHGNLKQYQLGIFDTKPQLADANLNQAINPITGFADACAESFWTESTTVSGSDEGYFSGLNSFDPPPEGECIGSTESLWSDLPDGPFVEKGGVAQQIRLYQGGVNPRNIYTIDWANSSVVAVSSGSDLTSDALSYLKGDTTGLVGGDTKIVDGVLTGPTAAAEVAPEVMPSSGLAATVHGDVVHSTPLSITYGSTQGQTVFRLFYGANDGLYRSIDPSTGREDWAIISPEHLSQVQRLYENTPSVEYSGNDLASFGIVDEPKSYFMDGNTGFYTVYNTNNQLTTGYIYPTMRRGGRLIYALDVSPSSSPGVPPASPTPLWQAGCTDVEVGTSCFDGAGDNDDLSDMGQTWSTPVVTKVNGNSNPVLLTGGGWNTCLDKDDADLSSACARDNDLTNSTGGEVGSAVFAFDAVTGALLASYNTHYPVVADVVVADVIGEDNVADVAYAMDVGGAVYRLSFVSAVGDSLTAANSNANWTFTKVAETTASNNLRFMNTPAIAPTPNAGKNYVFLAFGAGDREKPLETNYPYASSVNYKFYTMIDRLFAWDVPNDSPDNAALPLTSADRLIDLDDVVPVQGGNKTLGMFSVDENSALALPDNISNYDGWVFALSEPGEQIVNPAAISGGQVFFNSYNPEPESEASACSPELGVARAYSLPLFSPVYDAGREIDAPGIPIPPVIATVKLDPDASCVGDECPEDREDGSLITVCIGCEGFTPLEVVPLDDGSLKEVYRAENIDVQ